MKHPAGEVDGPEILSCATKTRLEKTDRVIIESHRGAAKRGDWGKLESKRDEGGTNRTLEAIGYQLLNLQP